MISFHEVFDSKIDITTDCISLRIPTIPHHFALQVAGSSCSFSIRHLFPQAFSVNKPHAIIRRLLHPGGVCLNNAC